MISAIQIGRALEEATFPIRSFEELHEALHRHMNVGEHCEGCEIGEMERLFSPRDFLFTNPGQIQRIVKARQCALVGEDSDVH